MKRYDAESWDCRLKTTILSLQFMLFLNIRVMSMYGAENALSDINKQTLQLVQPSEKCKLGQLDYN
jgi:hypothetical protein